MITVKIYLRLSLAASLILYSQSSPAPSLSDSLNSFGFNLLEATMKDADDNANLALSPYTMYTALSLILEGAKGNTAKQIEQVLQIPSNKRQFRTSFKSLTDAIARPILNVSLETSNALFSSAPEKIKEQFLEVAKKYYNLNVIPINFTDERAAADVINEYISKATKNRINNFIEPETISSDTKLFLASTLYFRGPWLSPFVPEDTMRVKFYNENGSDIGEVDLMYQGADGASFGKVPYIKSQILELPYGDGSSFSMYIILPQKGQTIKNVLAAIKSQPIDDLLKHLGTADDSDGKEINLPRFSAKTDLQATDILEKMGIVDLFEEDKSDLSGIYYNDLFVTSALQKSEIEVDEHGSTASSASGNPFSDRIGIDFTATRPFLYFIMDKVTKAVVFCGKISDPTVKH